MNIIDNKSTSFKDIEDNIHDYLSSLENWEDIQDALPGSNLTIITNMLAGYASYLSYKNKMMREETYLTTAKLSTSVYNIAKVFGYTINRHSAPSMDIRYDGFDTLTIKSGDVFGKYNDYEVIYFGVNDIIEHGEVINVQVGKYVARTETAELINNICELELLPDFLVSIDNQNMHIKVNDIEKDISKLIEDYIVYNKIVEYSHDIFSTKLMIADNTNKYGTPISKNDTIDIEYIETDGYDELLTVRNVVIIENWTPIEITHQGSQGDSLEKIKNLAPLYYSTMRRMVTEEDHRYIIEAHPYIKSAFAEREKGISYETIITMDPSGLNDDGVYSFNLGSFYYNYTSISGGADTLADVIENLYTKVKRNNTLTISFNDTQLIIKSNDARNDNIPKFIYESQTQSFAKNEFQVENIKPQCCTVNVWYIKHDTVTDPITLTYHEQDLLSDYLADFKLVGMRILMAPASVIYKDINIKIKLSENIFYDEVKTKFLQILNNYELKLNTKFSYGDLLAEVANISIINDGTLLYPVISIIPNQEIFDISAYKDQYIKFNNIELVNE